MKGNEHNALRELQGSEFCDTTVSECLILGLGWKKIAEIGRARE